MRDNLIDTSSDCDSAKLVPVRRKYIRPSGIQLGGFFILIFRRAPAPGTRGPSPGRACQCSGAERKEA